MFINISLQINSDYTILHLIFMKKKKRLKTDIIHDWFSVIRL